MVRVAAPLRVEAPRGGARREAGGVVVVVLQNKVHVPAGTGRPTADGQGLQNVRSAVILNRMHRVEPQAIEQELLQPIQRVVYEEAAHSGRVRPVEVGSRPP